jgi:uracil phosphoribosyltransferase
MVAIGGQFNAHGHILPGLVNADKRIYEVQ